MTTTQNKILIDELRQLHGGILVSLEELSQGRNYSQVDLILRQIERRFGVLISAAIGAGSSPDLPQSL